MNPKVQSHKAIAMVELIFAIVIMAIVLMSAPNLISQSTKSAYVALQQESVNAAASHLNIILTKEWDQGDAYSNIEPRVLHVTSGDIQLEKDATTNARLGTPNSSYRVFLTGTGLSPNAVPPSSFGEGVDSSSDTKPLDDIDDYHNTSNTLTHIADANEYNSDYKDKEIEMNTTVA